MDLFKPRTDVDQKVVALSNARVDLLGSFPSREDHVRFNKAVIQTAGFTAIVPKEDKGGNCAVCGEAGRCPGVHAVEFTL